MCVCVCVCAEVFVAVVVEGTFRDFGGGGGYCLYAVINMSFSVRNGAPSVKTHCMNQLVHIMWCGYDSQMGTP